MESENDIGFHEFLFRLLFFLTPADNAARSAVVVSLVLVVLTLEALGGR